MKKPPIVVDLDGTLVFTDMLHEMVVALLKEKPWYVFLLPFWLFKGKAHLKQKLSNKFTFKADSLPYNQELISWLQEQKIKGYSLVLCTASDISIAKAIAIHLDLFDQVIASDGCVNLAGSNKAKVLIQNFGEKAFDYAGNSKIDLLVWEYSKNAIVVNASPKVLSRAQSKFNVSQVFAPRKFKLAAYLKSLRVHQWLKNLLLFIPLLASHQVLDFNSLQKLLFAFISFSLCASAVYIANDLLDLESDRQHPRKKLRPFASGALPIWQGIIFAPILFISSLCVSSFVNKNFTYGLLVYFFITCWYSWKLKRLAIIDCIALALLYTIRIIAGALAIQNILSFWLLAFSVFLFLSLAFVKRYAELEVMILKGSNKVHGRAYLTTDAPLIQTMGVTSGYASVLVLALYLNSEIVQKLYKTPEIIWAAVPVMLFWISWIWLQAHHGKMHDDPVIFAVKDKASLISGVIFALILMAGALGFKS